MAGAVSSDGPGSEQAALVVRRCAVDVATAVDRCTAELARRRIHLFAVFDHGAGARSAGMPLPAEVVVVFGDPAVGTRLMQADPTIGVELPLRLLLWEHDESAHVGFVDPMSWPARYALPADHPVLVGMRHLLDELAELLTVPD